METRSVCLTGIEEVEVITRKLDISDDEVLIKSHMSGICGSDKNLYLGIAPPNGGLNTEMRKAFVFPFFIGHEGAGEVVAVGKAVREIAIGDRVMSFGWIETCSEYFKATEEDLETVPEGLSMDLASLGEPTACAMFSAINSGIKLGDIVAVVGMGFAGQIIAQVAKKIGAHRTIGVDVVDKKLELAASLGLDHPINAARENPMEAILEYSHGNGADVIIEAAGTEGAVNLCSAAVRHNGTIVFYSWITQDITINISRWHNNSLTVLNTGLVHHGILQRKIWTPPSLRPVLQKQIDIAPLITHRFPISKAQDAFRTAADDPAAIKVMLYPDD